MDYTTRCNAAERKYFGPNAKASGRTDPTGSGEPCLGTLNERLDILLRRLANVGGTHRGGPLTKDEKLLHQAWLLGEGLES